MTARSRTETNRVLTERPESMSRRALSVSAVLAVAGSAPVAADQLSLQEAMSRGRESAYEVSAAHARARAGEERVEQAQSYRWPRLSAQEIWVRTDAPADVFGLLLQQERFSFADFVSSDPNNPDPLENALTRFEATLPLYTGGELSGRVRQARLASEATGVGAEWAEDLAALAAAEAYIRLVQTREVVILLESSLETVDHHVGLAGAYVEQGVIVRSELLRAEVERSRIEDLLAEARAMARVAAANLSFRLAVDAATPWELEPLPRPAPLEGSLESRLAGVGNRGDLRAARLMLEAGELEVRVRRAGYLPKIGLAARYDLNDDSLLGSSGQSTTLMAVASIDLFSGGRHRAARAEAEAEVDAASAEITGFEEGARLEVRGAFEKARSARERHETALIAREAAAEAERIVEARFEQGVVKVIDLLDASTARLEAETRELAARAEALLADLTLALRSGRAPESATTRPAGDTEKEKE